MEKSRPIQIDSSFHELTTKFLKEKRYTELCMQNSNTSFEILKDPKEY